MQLVFYFFLTIDADTYVYRLNGIPHQNPKYSWPLIVCNNNTFAETGVTLYKG